MPRSADPAGRSRRAYRSREERRAEIVEATLAILAEEGMHAWTTAALAARVGCSEATLFKHFASKDEILTEALRRQAAALRRRAAAYSGRGSGWEKAEGLVLHLLDAVVEAEGGPLVILLGQAARLHPEMGREVRDTLGLVRSRLERFLAEDDGVGEREAVPPAVLADVLIAVGQSSALRWMASERGVPPAEIARPMLRALRGRVARRADLRNGADDGAPGPARGRSG